MKTYPTINLLFFTACFKTLLFLSRMAIGKAAPAEFLPVMQLFKGTGALPERQKVTSVGQETSHALLLKKFCSLKIPFPQPSERPRHLLVLPQIGLEVPHSTNWVGGSTLFSKIATGLPTGFLHFIAGGDSLGHSKAGSKSSEVKSSGS